MLLLGTVLTSVALFSSHGNAFVVPSVASSTRGWMAVGNSHMMMAISSATVTAESGAKAQIGKPTGTFFLPEGTIERAKKGSPIEKIKLEKDGTAAFVDVYEYARKIRDGEMTWEDVDKADLDNVCQIISLYVMCGTVLQNTKLLSPSFCLVTLDF